MEQSPTVKYMAQFYENNAYRMDAEAAAAYGKSLAEASEKVAEKAGDAAFKTAAVITIPIVVVVGVLGLAYIFRPPRA